MKWWIGGLLFGLVFSAGLVSLASADHCFTNEEFDRINSENHSVMKNRGEMHRNFWIEIWETEKKNWYLVVRDGEQVCPQYRGAQWK